MGCATSKAVDEPTLLSNPEVVPVFTPIRVRVPAAPEELEQRLSTASTTRGGNDASHQVLSPSALPLPPPARVRKRTRRKPNSQAGDDVGEVSEMIEDESVVNDGRLPMVAVGARRMVESGLVLSSAQRPGLWTRGPSEARGGCMLASS